MPGYMRVSVSDFLSCRILLGSNAIAGLSVDSGKIQELVDTVNSVLKQKYFNLPSDRCTKLQEFGMRLITAMTAASDQDTATSVVVSGFTSG